jgi:hypothetical protein
MKKTILGAIAVAVVCSVSLAAQWPKHEDAGVPRDAKGNPRLDAPPPRTAEGKPDFSGIWQRSDRDPIPAQLAGLFAEQAAGRGGRGAPPPTPPQPAQAPPDPNSPPTAAFWDIGTNLKDGLPMTPWAAELKKQRMAADSINNPDANCLPLGIHPLHTHPDPRKIVQTPKVLIWTWEANYGLRYIYTDGRKLPPLGDPQPWWYGYSVGHWEGDTLVVETNNQRAGTIDRNGIPYSDKLTAVERIRRVSPTRMEIETTLTDPEAFVVPFTMKRAYVPMPRGSRFEEYICENNKDL